MTEYTKAQINRMAYVMNEMLLEEDAELSRHYEQKTGKDVEHMAKKEGIPASEIATIMQSIDNARKQGRRFASVNHSQAISNYRNALKHEKTFTECNKERMLTILSEMTAKPDEPQTEVEKEISKKIFPDGPPHFVLDIKKMIEEEVEKCFMSLPVHKLSTETICAMEFEHAGIRYVLHVEVKR